MSGSIPCFRDAPHLAGAHQPGLHLVGDVERPVALAQRLHPLQVAGVREREAVRRRNGLDQHRRAVTGAERGLHLPEVVERNVRELIRAVGQEEARETVVARGHGEAGVAVVPLEDGDDPAPPAGVARRLDRNVGRLAAARAVDHPAHVRRARLDQGLRQRRPRQRGKVMVADVEALHRLLERRDQLRVAVPQVVGAAVQVQVDESPAGHVPEEVALAPVDDEVDAGVLPEVGLVRVPELPRPLEEVVFRLVREEPVVVHGADAPYLIPDQIATNYLWSGPTGW